MNMTERGFIPDFAQSEQFEDLHLSLIVDAGGNLEAIRSLVQDGRLSESDVVRLSKEIDVKIKDNSYFDDLTSEQMGAVKAIQDYLSEVKIHEDVEPDLGTEKFGSDVLGTALDLESPQDKKTRLGVDGYDLVGDLETPTSFGSGALGKAIDQDADPGTEIIGRPASTLDDSSELDMNQDSDLGLKNAA